MVLQYPCATIWKHSDQILNTVKYLQYRQILGIANRTHFYSQYLEIPSATVGSHMGMHQIPLDTYGNPEYSNYLLFSVFSDGHEAARKDGDHRPQTNTVKYRILSNTAKYYMGTSLYGFKLVKLSSKASKYVDPNSPNLP